MNHAPPRVESRGLPFWQWFIDHGIGRFDVAVARRDALGRQHQFLSPTATGHRDLVPDQVLRLLPWLRAENAHGADIYIRPSRVGTWPVVFLDDIPTAFALRITRKYAGCLVETSPGRTHLWLASQHPLACHERFLAQKYLVARLRGLADSGSLSGDHWGRLPGMRNRKPARNCWVNLIGQSYRRRWRPLFHAGAPHQPQPHAPHPSPQPKTDPSRNEWGWVMGALEQRQPPEIVLQRLIEHAKPRRGSDSIRYARVTVRKACHLLGLRPPP